MARLLSPARLEGSRLRYQGERTHEESVVRAGRSIAVGRRPRIQCRRRSGPEGCGPAAGHEVQVLQRQHPQRTRASAVQADAAGAAGEAAGEGEGQDLRGLDRPARAAAALGHRQDLRDRGGVREHAASVVPRRGVAVRPACGAAVLPRRRERPAVQRPAAQPDRRAEPHDRQLDAVAGRLQRPALREHVLQPDEDVLRASVVRPVLDRGRRPRLGEGAVQRGQVRARSVRLDRLH
jgi:hypothetical protein